MSPTPEEQRTHLAEALASKAGLDPEQAGAFAEAAKADEGFLDALAEALVAAGAYQPNPDAGGRVRIEELDPLPPESVLIAALDRCRAKKRSSLEDVRLARLYDLTGQEEKAASCFRAALAHPEPLPLALAVDVAEAAARGGRTPLALAAIDWVAECLLTPDDAARTDDTTDQDASASGALLERSAAVALSAGQTPRAVALAKAALNAYERSGLGERVRASYATLTRALTAAGEEKAALNAAKQLRARAQADEAPDDEALAMRLVAERMEAGGKLKEAKQLHEQAAKLLLRAGRKEGAVLHLRERARLAVESGRHEQARTLLEQAAKQVAKEPHLALALRTELAELDLHLARLDQVLALGDKLRKGWESLKEPRLAARAVVLQAHTLLLAGDAERASKALARCALEVDDWHTAGRALRVRAALAEVHERSGEARGLLVDATRALREAGQHLEACEALLRRAELALDEGHPDACQKDLQRLASLGALPPQLSLREELVQARLCSDLDEREILLEEVVGNAEEAGLLYERALAAAAKARHHQAAGDADLGQEALTPVMRDLVAVRDKLPEPLREGFRRSPLIRELLAIGRALEG